MGEDPGRARHVTKPFVVLFQSRALLQMDEARAWLREHRGGTSTFDAAMARTLDRLTNLPRSSPCVQIGGRWSRARHASLGRAGYKLY
jgi:hypothetical protein